MAAPYTNLEPSAADLGVIPTFNNNTPSLDSTVQFVYFFLFSIIVIAAFYRLIVAGVKRTVASEASIRASNDIFKQTTLGLLGVFSLFLILTLVNKDLVSGKIGLGGLTSSVSGVPQGTSGTQSTSPTTPSSPVGSGPWWDAIKEDPAVRSMLAGLPKGGIAVNKPVCSDPNKTSCTTVGGWPQSTKDMLVQLRSDCPGSITVTGGTEAGHYSHGPGKTPVDLSKTVAPCVKAFPKASFMPKRGGGADLCYPGEVYAKYGYVFCDEQGSDPHYHVFIPGR